MIRTKLVSAGLLGSVSELGWDQVQAKGGLEAASHNLGGVVPVRRGTQRQFERGRASTNALFGGAAGGVVFKEQRIADACNVTIEGERAVL